MRPVDDGCAWFIEHDGLMRADGSRFRKMILSIGDTPDLQKADEDWRGRPPEIGPVLNNCGLAGHGDDSKARQSIG